MADQIETDWRTLTEQADYRVLTFPDGRTVSADSIYMVGAFRYCGLGSGKDGDRKCAIHVRHPSNAGDAWKVTTLFLEADEDGALFEIATRAHRMYGGRA